MATHVSTHAANNVNNKAAYINLNDRPLHPERLVKKNYSMLVFQLYEYSRSQFHLGR